MSSELLDREPEIRAAAKDCSSLFDLAKKFPRWPMESIRKADEDFNLGLSPDHELTANRAKKASPKPEGKGKKPPAKKEGGE